MNKIRVLIVDDEEEARDLLVNLLAEIDFVEVTGVAAHADQALELIIEHKPELLFLDIEMPEKDAFALIREVKNIGLEIAVIMVTGYKKYALDAIKEQVVDYLVKPVDRKDLLTSLLRFRKRMGLNTHAAGEDHKIKIATRTGIIYLNPNRIVYLEADSNYTRIHLLDNNTEIASSTLGKMAELCDERFVRISRSYMINIHYLYKVNRKQKNCVLQVAGQNIVLPVPEKNIRLLI